MQQPKLTIISDINVKLIPSNTPQILNQDSDKKTAPTKEFSTFITSPTNSPYKYVPLPLTKCEYNQHFITEIDERIDNSLPIPSQQSNGSFSPFIYNSPSNDLHLPHLADNFLQKQAEYPSVVELVRQSNLDQDIDIVLSEIHGIVLHFKELCLIEEQRDAIKSGLLMSPQKAAQYAKKERNLPRPRHTLQ